MTRDELLALPVSVDLVTAGRALGCGRTQTYELARSGELPFPVQRLGNRYRVNREDLLRTLGVTEDEPAVSRQAALNVHSAVPPGTWTRWADQPAAAVVTARRALPTTRPDDYPGGPARGPDPQREAP